MITTRISRAFAMLLLVFAFSPVQASQCLKVTLTGTKGGPAAFNGLAGVGTLVQYGDVSSGCKGVMLQFDAGRATSVRLSQLGITAGEIDALFITHVHSDHTDGLADLMQLRWHYESSRPNLDLVCSVDKQAESGHANSCVKLATHIAANYVASGEIAQRHSERSQIPAAGPSSLITLKTFDPAEKPALVWSSGQVEVRAIRSTHTAGHASYRVDTPAGSVVISGDASNDVTQPPRKHSTSDQVEMLSEGAEVLVHATTHPNMGPERGGGMPPRIFYRQSTAIDIGAMAQRAKVKHLVLTHLTPSLGEVKRIDRWQIPGAPLTAKDFLDAVLEGGYKGQVTVGTDLFTLQLPAQ